LVYFEVFQLGDERATDANCAVIAEHVRVGLGIQCPPSITAGVSIADHDENAVEDCVGFGPFTSVCTGFPSWAHRAGKPHLSASLSSSPSVVYLHHTQR
jgi:hypothetical protein